MAIISGSVGAVAGIGKLLAGGITKKKIMAGAGNALKGAAKGGVKKALGRKKRRGGPGSPGGEEGGGIVQSPGGSIVPTSPLLGDIVVPYPTEHKRPEKPVGRVDYKSISEQLQSIVAIIAQLNRSLVSQSRPRRKSRIQIGRIKRNGRKRDKEENRLRYGRWCLSYLGSKVGEVGKYQGSCNS